MADPHFQAHILTLFPEMFPGPLGHSLAGRALQQGIWDITTWNIRDYTLDKHNTVDDTPYGGGAGMVMRADVLDNALQAAHEQAPGTALLFPSPRGKPVQQADIRRWCASGVTILCGRYEGVDERILQAWPFEEVSIGDIVLSGGEIPALAILDACVRLLPGVMGAEDAGHEESFGASDDYAHLLEYPHYTRPQQWNGREVPEVLRSGNHGAVDRWRLEQAENITKSRRPDLWQLHLAKKKRK